MSYYKIKEVHCVLSKYEQILEEELLRLGNSKPSLEEVPKDYKVSLPVFHRYVTCKLLGLNAEYAVYSISDNILKEISSINCKIQDKNLMQYFEKEVLCLYKILTKNKTELMEGYKIFKQFVDSYEVLFRRGYKISEYGVYNIGVCLKMAQKGYIFNDIRKISCSYYKVLAQDTRLDLKECVYVCNKYPLKVAKNIIQYMSSEQLCTYRGYLDTEYVDEILFAIKYGIQLEGVNIDYWSVEQLHEVLVGIKYGVDISEFTSMNSPKYIAYKVSKHKLDNKINKIKNIKYI